MDEIVIETENGLRKAESDLEAIGRKICDVAGSATTHGYINIALDNVRAAIRHAYLMRGED